MTDANQHVHTQKEMTVVKIPNFLPGHQKGSISISIFNPNKYYTIQ